MTFALTNPSSPNTSDSLTSLPIRQNFQSIQSFLNSMDGSLIQSGTVGDAQIANAVNPRVRSGEAGWNFVVSGLNPAVPGSGLVVTIPGGTVYVNGYRVVSLGTSVTCTASSDCYVDIDQNGTFYTSNVTNNTASPALGANRVRLMIIVGGAANVASINQGSTAATAPVVSSNTLTVCDTLGNLIYPTSPSPGLIGYRQVSSAQGSITTNVAITGLSCPVIIPTGRRAKVRAFCGAFNSPTAGTGVNLFLYNGVAVSGTQIQLAATYMPTGGTSNSLTCETFVSSNGSQTYAASISMSNAGTLGAGGNQPNILSVELV